MEDLNKLIQYLDKGTQHGAFSLPDATVIGQTAQNLANTLQKITALEAENTKLKAAAAEKSTKK